MSFNNLNRLRAKLSKCSRKLLPTTLIVLCVIAADLIYHHTACASMVRVDAALVSITAERLPLTVILDEFTSQGIRIRIDPGINPLISASFHDRPIGPAISSILKSLDYVLIWERDGSNSASEPHVSEIQIFRPGQRGENQPLYQSPNLSVDRGRNGELYVKDTLLLVLDPSLDEAEFEALLARLGAALIDRHDGLGIVRLRLPDNSDIEAIVEAISEIPGVQIAEPDYVHELEGSEPVHEYELSVEPLQPPADADGTVVAVMDSGLAPGYENNPFVAGVYDAVSPGRTTGDQVGHGTQMVLVASGAVNPLGAGGEPGADTPVIAIRTFDDNGFTSNHTLLRGIEYALEHNAKVVSLSWGTPEISPFLGSVMQYAERKGLVIVAAAGNSPTGRPVYPAALKSVIGVGALSASGNPWPRSNHGAFVSISAPGIANLPVGANGAPGVYAGTSIAAAYTARRIARILSTTPQANRATILRRLSSSPR